MGRPTVERVIQEFHNGGDCTGRSMSTYDGMIFSYQTLIAAPIPYSSWYVYNDATMSTTTTKHQSWIRYSLRQRNKPFLTIRECGRGSKLDTLLRHVAENLAKLGSPGPAGSFRVRCRHQLHTLRVDTLGRIYPDGRHDPAFEDFISLVKPDLHNRCAEVVRSFRENMKPNDTFQFCWKYFCPQGEDLMEAWRHRKQVEVLAGTAAGDYLLERYGYSGSKKAA